MKSRKLIFASGCVLLFTGLLVSGVITPDLYTNLLNTVVPAYILGNVGEHFARKNSN